MYSELWSIVDRGGARFLHGFLSSFFFPIRLVFAGCRGVRAASGAVELVGGPPAVRFFQGRNRFNALTARPLKFTD